MSATDVEHGDGWVWRPQQGGHTEELMPVDSLQVGEPFKCARGHGFGYDRSQCLDCVRRREWVRKTVKTEGSRAPVVMPEPVSLADLLAEPEEPTRTWSTGCGRSAATSFSRRQPRSGRPR